MSLDAYLNPHFNNYNYEPTQNLYQDILVQSIQMSGVEVIYIPRNIVNFDKIYSTDDQSTYTTPLKTICYLESLDGFAGDKDIFTKFGLEIRDQIVLGMARRTFEKTIKPTTKQPRPMEGDLIYFALNNKCFQIKFTNNKEIFYPLGILPLYRMTLELFEYSDETFNTGIPEIDSIQKLSSLNVLDNTVTTDNGFVLTDEEGVIITVEGYDEQNIDPITDGDALQANANPIINSNTSNPFGWI